MQPQDSYPTENMVTLTEAAVEARWLKMAAQTHISGMNTFHRWLDEREWMKDLWSPSIQTQYFCDQRNANQPWKEGQGGIQ